MTRVGIACIALFGLLAAGCGGERGNGGDVVMADGTVADRMGQPGDVAADVRFGDDGTTALEVERPPADGEGNEATVPPLDPAIQAVVDRFEAERIELQVPGAALALVIDGKLHYAGGSGSRKPGQTDPVNGTTLFRFGSILKMMTATALLQQLEQGKLGLDDALVQHLPDFTLQATPDEVPDIKVRNLLNHTSGMYDYLMVDTPGNQQTPEMLHDYLLGPFQYYSCLMSPPGRMYNYSNPNFMLAGLLVETTSGEYFRDYIAAHVWEPLDMVRTTLYVDEVLEDGDYAVALGPDPQSGETVELTPDAYDNVWGGPAGFGWTSAEELAAFAGFLMEGNPVVLADETRALLVTERVNTEEAVDLSWYGLGIGVVEGIVAEAPAEYYPVTVWQHAGGINGFASNLVILPDFGFAIVTLASGDGAFFPKTVALATRTLVTLPDPEPIPFTPDGPEQFVTYAGDYLDPFNVGSIKVFVEADELHISLPDLDAMEMAYEPVLVPGLPRNFLLVLEGFALPLTFILDGEGKSEYLRTRVAVGKRVEIPDGQASKLAPRLDRERLLRALRVATVP